MIRGVSANITINKENNEGRPLGWLVSWLADRPVRRSNRHAGGELYREENCALLNISIKVGYISGVEQTEYNYT